MSLETFMRWVNEMGKKESDLRELRRLAKKYHFDLIKGDQGDHLEVREERTGDQSI